MYEPPVVKITIAGSVSFLEAAVPTFLSSLACSRPASSLSSDAQPAPAQGAAAAVASSEATAITL